VDAKATIVSPWLTIAQAAAYAQVGVKGLYLEVQLHRLGAARVGDRRADLRFRREWIDAWLEASTNTEGPPR
jgi:excisionase family DNA binding protein